MRPSVSRSVGVAGHFVLTVCIGLLHAVCASASGPPFLVASDFTIGGIGHDRFTDLVVDAGGNVYVVGRGAMNSCGASRLISDSQRRLVSKTSSHMQVRKALWER